MKQPLSSRRLRCAYHAHPDRYSGIRWASPQSGKKRCTAALVVSSPPAGTAASARISRFRWSSGSYRESAQAVKVVSTAIARAHGRASSRHEVIVRQATQRPRDCSPTISVTAHEPRGFPRLPSFPNLHHISSNTYEPGVGCSDLRSRLDAWDGKAQLFFCVAGRASHQRRFNYYASRISMKQPSSWRLLPWASSPTSE